MHGVCGPCLHASFISVRRSLKFMGRNHERVLRMGAERDSNSRERARRSGTERRTVFNPTPSPIKSSERCISSGFEPPVGCGCNVEREPGRCLRSQERRVSDERFAVAKRPNRTEVARTTEKPFFPGNLAGGDQLRRVDASRHVRSD